MRSLKRLRFTMNVTQLMKWIGPHRRVHLTKTKYTSARTTAQSKTPSFKPQGLWYACGNAWFKYLREEGMSVREQCCYIYELTPTDFTTSLTQANRDKILRIHTLPHLQQFTKQYGVRGYANMTRIDWHKVAARYGGVEFCPYFKKQLKNNDLITTYAWYSIFDVPSGAVWQANIIRRAIRLVALKTKSGRWQRVSSKQTTGMSSSVQTLQRYTVPELKALARKRKHVGYSCLRKAELVRLLSRPPKKRTTTTRPRRRRVT